MPISRRGVPPKPYIADYYDQLGERHQIPCATPMDARVEILTNGGLKSAKDIRETTVGELFEYVWRAREDNPRPGNIYASRVQCQLHVLPSIEQLQVRKVDKGHLARILAGMVERLADDTIGGLVSYICTVFDIAVALGCIRKNITRAAYVKAPRKQPPRTPEMPKTKDVARLMASASGWVRVRLALFLYGGLTPPEAGGLPWDAVDFGKRLLVVSQRQYKQTIVPLAGYRQSRPVPMTTELHDILLAWRADPRSGRRLVLHPDRKLRTEVTLKLPLARLQVELGLVTMDREKGPGWCDFEDGGPRYREMQFRLVAVARWHRERNSLETLATLLGLVNSNTLIPFVKSLADERDLQLMGEVDANLDRFLNSAPSNS